MTRAVWLVLAGIASVQLGAAVAKDLFDRVDPTALVWLRLVASAVLLLALARPRLRGRSRGDWQVVAGFALTLAVMNWAFYQSFARLPLGVAVTIELIGPLAVALAGSRRVRDLLWVLLAGIGVTALGWERTALDPVGVAYAVLAGTGWACYILLSAQTGRRWPGLDGLSVASAGGALMLAPFALAADLHGLLDPQVLALGALIGLLSSVIPYSFELIALRSLRPSVFGILMSVEPAAAALAALLVLGESLSVLQWTAIGCVVAASAGATLFTQTSHDRDTTVLPAA
ncbi:EamA family transporter [Nocardioides campestrisoli]|uniref:EamA family transporter n=1 Tax=Nocardioides campestrisoli TaxID=2736757 RepID=UPI00163DD229|nr:EamA family transporter [Nocardioides campestrisoli]